MCLSAWFLSINTWTTRCYSCQTDDGNILIYIGIAVAAAVVIAAVIAGVSFFVTWQTASKAKSAARSPRISASSPAAVFARPISLRPDMYGWFAPTRPNLRGYTDCYYNNHYYKLR